MNQLTTLSLRQEELIYLLHLLKIPSLAGISPHSTNGMNAYQLVALMNTAERTLSERNLLATNPGGDSVIESTLFDTLSFCARPDHTLAISRHTLAETPACAAYYLSDRIRVKHDVHTGWHRFALLPDDTSVFDDVFGLITAHENVSKGVRGTAHYQVPAMLLLALARIRTTDDLDLNTLIRQLVSEGLSEGGAIHLARLVRHEMIASITITAEKRRRYPKSNTHVSAPAPIFNVMQTQDAWWLAIPAAEEHPHTHTYTLTAMSTGTLYARLNDLLMPPAHKAINGNGYQA